MLDSPVHLLQTQASPRMRLSRAAYCELLTLARRYARYPLEAEDLLHESLIAALAAGRASSVENRAWLCGVMRNLAAMNARSAARRAKREQQSLPTTDTPPTAFPSTFIRTLPSGLRIVALLALAGHTRGEMRHLLCISDQALRQRISTLRKRWDSRRDEESPIGNHTLTQTLAFGAIRRSLLPVMRRGMAQFASHDPDGHLFAIKIPAAAPHKPAPGGNKELEEINQSRSA